MLEGNVLYEISYNEIASILPQKPPFIFVDKVKVMGLGKGIGVKNVTSGEYFFTGHFPGNPVMPGVLLVEAMVQTSGVLVLDLLRRELAEGKSRGKETGQALANWQENQAERTAPPVYFLSIDSARFRRPVRPGDVVEMHAEPKRSRGLVWRYMVEAYVDNALAASADCTAALIENDSVASGMGMAPKPTLTGVK